jgi:hypothetical protein
VWFVWSSTYFSSAEEETLSPSLYTTDIAFPVPPRRCRPGGVTEGLLPTALIALACGVAPMIFCSHQSLDHVQFKPNQSPISIPISEYASFDSIFLKEDKYLYMYVYPIHRMGRNTQTRSTSREVRSGTWYWRQRDQQSLGFRVW